MGANLSLQELIKLRDKLIEEILNNFSNWTNSIDSGISIIESNGIKIDSLKTTDNMLKELSDIPLYDEEYINKLGLILDKQKELIQTLEDNRRTLLEEANQFSKKNKVIDNYVSVNNDSIFIDRDIF